MSDTSKTVKSDSSETAKVDKAEGVIEEQETVAPADDPTAAPVTVVDPRLLVREEGFKGYVTEFKRKVKGGELGSLPVFVGLIVIWTIFQLQNDRFLSADNLSNISYYMSATGMLAIGLVFVLLLGEIDLSVGSVSGLSSTLFAVFAVNNGMDPGCRWSWRSSPVSPSARCRAGSSPGSVCRRSSSRWPASSAGTA